MTKKGNTKEKRLARERMARTGENYTTALRAVRAEYEAQQKHDEVRCTGGHLLESISFRINDLSEARHRDGGLCTHQIWIDKHIVYDGRVHLPWSRPDANPFKDIQNFKDLVRRNPNMTAEDLQKGNYDK